MPWLAGLQTHTRTRTHTHTHTRCTDGHTRLTSSCFSECYSLRCPGPELSPGASSVLWSPRQRKWSCLDNVLLIRRLLFLIFFLLSSSSSSPRLRKQRWAVRRLLAHHSFTQGGVCGNPSIFVVWYKSGVYVDFVLVRSTRPLSVRIAAQSYPLDMKRARWLGGRVEPLPLISAWAASRSSSPSSTSSSLMF